MGFVLIKFDVPAQTDTELNTLVEDITRPKEQASELSNLLDSVLAGAVDAEVTVSIRESTLPIPPDGNGQTNVPSAETANISFSSNFTGGASANGAGTCTLKYGTQTVTSSFTAQLSGYDATTLQNDFRAIPGLEFVTVTGNQTSGYVVTFTEVESPEALSIESNTMHLYGQYFVELNGTPDAGTLTLEKDGSVQTTPLDFDSNAATINTRISTIDDVSPVSIRDDNTFASADTGNGMSDGSFYIITRGTNYADFEINANSLEESSVPLTPDVTTVQEPEDITVTIS